MTPFYMKIYAIYDFIAQYQNDNKGLSPTLKEIEAAVDINYTTLKRYLAKMELMGMLERPPGKGRAIKRIRREANWNALIEE